LLYRAIERAFLVVVNKCGVDVNAAASFPHLSHTLQFVCGLGPRKSQAIISKILRSGGKLGSRAELVQKLGMGPTIFVNCASFIRIRDFHFHGTFYDFTLDVLDDSRVHPEDYRLARQMAVDALDLEDAVVDEDENPSAHVQELIETDVERLNTLMLDDYALELERRMHCPKRICLIDIKDELMNRYRDTRQTFQVPNDEQIFTILSGESRDTLYEGAIISVVVTRVHSRYFHVQLGSGLYGFVPGINTDVLPGDDLTQMYQPDQALLAYVTRVNYERLSVELSTKQHDVETNKTQLRLDQYFDLDLQRQHNAEKKSMKKPQIEKQVRQIQHPYWQNINYRAAEKYLASRPRGEIVVRPSSSGKDHISITWKVDDGIYQHIDVLEQNKTSEITLGKRLIIEDQVFTEIDQILAEFVEPMTRKIALLIDHPKYQRKNTSEMCMFTYFNLVEYLNEQVKVLKRSAYGFIICSEKPGSFFLVYRHPANSPRQETVTVRPFGFEFRKKRYQDINDLLASFKQHEAARATEQKRRDGYIPTRIDPRQAGRDTRAPDRRQAYPDNRGRAAPTDAYRSSNTYGSRGY
jgi:transcription elongation factor SPT6